MRDVLPHTGTVVEPIKLLVELFIQDNLGEVAPKVDPEEPTEGVEALGPGEIVQWVIEDVAHASTHSWESAADNERHPSY